MEAKQDKRLSVLYLYSYCTTLLKLAAVRRCSKGQSIRAASGVVLAECSESLYELCQASQLVPLPTSPKITSRRDRFLLRAVSGGRGRGGGPWRRLWVQGGVGGFAYDRAIFPDSLTRFPRGTWKWTYCNWHESLPCYRWFGTSVDGKHACSRLSNSLFLLGFAFSFRIADYIVAG